MGSLDLRLAKQQFLYLMDAVSEQQLPQFAIWLDVKLAEYKILGQVTGAQDEEEYPVWIRSALRTHLQNMFGIMRDEATADLMGSKRRKPATVTRISVENKAQTPPTPMQFSCAVNQTEGVDLTPSSRSIGVTSTSMPFVPSFVSPYKPTGSDSVPRKVSDDRNGSSMASPYASILEEGPLVGNSFTFNEDIKPEISGFGGAVPVALEVCESPTYEASASNPPAKRSRPPLNAGNAAMRKKGRPSKRAVDDITSRLLKRAKSDAHTVKKKPPAAGETSNSEPRSPAPSPVKPQSSPTTANLSTSGGVQIMRNCWSRRAAFSMYKRASGITVPVRAMNHSDLDELLASFFRDVRGPEGEEYCYFSYASIKFETVKQLGQEFGYKLKLHEFPIANDVYKRKVQMKRTLMKDVKPGEESIKSDDTTLNIPDDVIAITPASDGPISKPFTSDVFTIDASPPPNPVPHSPSSHDITDESSSKNPTSSTSNDVFMIESRTVVREPEPKSADDGYEIESRTIVQEPEPKSADDGYEIESRTVVQEPEPKSADDGYEIEYLTDSQS